MTLEEKARQLAWGLIPAGVPVETFNTVAAAMVQLAREHAAAAIRGSFYPQRDAKLPGVWLMCRHRDEDGEELIDDIRVFSREADVKKQIEMFIAAALAEAEKETGK